MVKVYAQGKHRYYALERADVAAALEALSVLAGASSTAVAPPTPHRLRDARTCYDHIAGTLGVLLYDRFVSLGWVSAPSRSDAAVDVTASGQRGFEALGIDLAATRALRRRFAFACLDWSERRPHLGGALGAAVLDLARRRRWIAQDLDSRALRVTAEGRREMLSRFSVDVSRRHDVTTAR